MFILRMVDPAPMVSTHLAEKADGSKYPAIVLNTKDVMYQTGVMFNFAPGFNSSTCARPRTRNPE